MSGAGAAQKASALRAYRVKRKLLGQSGAPLVTTHEEFWRARARRHAGQKVNLDAYVAGWYGRGMSFQGTEARPITILKDGRIYTWRASRGEGFERRKDRLAGRLFREGALIHKKRAPRWLKRWAEGRYRTYVASGPLTRAALRALLVKEVLTR